MTSATFRTEFLAAGGSSNPQSADWDFESGLVAFAAGSSVAVWSPKDSGVRIILGGHVGHSAQVNAVRFVPGLVQGKSVVISASADNTLKLWLVAEDFSFSCLQTLEGHDASVNVVAVAGDVIISGSVDGVLKVWKISNPVSGSGAACIATTMLSPKFIPLCFSASKLSDSSYLCAVSGTTNKVYIYQLDSAGLQFKASLPGHDGWIRSLDIRRDGESLVLASASQDKYIRIWRTQQGSEKSSDDFLQKTLENKAHRLQINGQDWIVTFEALLLGHEDWLFSARWKPTGPLELLSASADNTLAFWSADPETGVWVNSTRLGYMTVVKGGTSATGSAGGHWVGLWSGDGKSVISLGRSGGWRRWDSDDGLTWQQKPAVTGHWKEVNGICWSRDGSYLLSTSADQTTRLWAKQLGGTWHEFARPQIHGYDLNCIDTVKATQFVSGAEEKLLRVFDQPKSTAQILKKLCGIDSYPSDLPEAANIPALGLSNKAVDSKSEDTSIQKEFNGPPLEDDLARHTLWPEREKLYGHGFEISALSCSHDGTLVATACKASSIDHALIRIFSTSDWKELKPPLKGHSLTITRLRFSPDDQYLVSVGRDREINLFKRDFSEPSKYEFLVKKEKAHTRMILDVAWASATVFATAGRDKKVTVWTVKEGKIVSSLVIATTQPVTAVDALVDQNIWLAVGLEDGSVILYSIDASMDLKSTTELDEKLSPAKTITQIAWRPRVESSKSGPASTVELAIASADSIVRILSVQLGS